MTRLVKPVRRAPRNEGAQHREISIFY